MKFDKEFPELTKRVHFDMSADHTHNPDHIPTGTTSIWIKTKDIRETCIDKQRVRDAIVISKSINQTVEDYICELKKELRL